MPCKNLKTLRLIVIKRVHGLPSSKDLLFAIYKCYSLRYESYKIIKCKNVIGYDVKVIKCKNVIVVVVKRLWAVVQHVKNVKIL